jgi:hypothetical protein
MVVLESYTKENPSENPDIFNLNTKKILGLLKDVLF